MATNRRIFFVSLTPFGKPIRIEWKAPLSEVRMWRCRGGIVFRCLVIEGVGLDDLIRFRYPCFFSKDIRAITRRVGN